MRKKACAFFRVLSTLYCKGMKNQVTPNDEKVVYEGMIFDTKVYDSYIYYCEELHVFVPRNEFAEVCHILFFSFNLELHLSYLFFRN